MSLVPETHYARDGDVHLAYQVVGDRGPDLLYVPTPTFPIDLLWDEPTVAGTGEVLVSGVMPPLVLGSGIAFDDRGTHELKGVPDAWPVLPSATLGHETSYMLIA